MPDDIGQPHRRPWRQKFADCLRGIADATRTCQSFQMHLVAAVIVIATAAVLRVSRIEWCVLLICVSVVLAAELLNSAIESVAHAMTQEHNEHLRRGLDAAAGAVFVAASGAVAVGVIVFLQHIPAFSP